MRVQMMTVAMISLLVLSGCAGTGSRETPIEVFGDMAHQPKLKAQRGNAFYPNGSTQAGPVPGTIAMGQYVPEDVLHTGVAGKDYVGRMPVEVTPALLKAGETKYNVYCTPCHSRVGDGRGIVGARSGWIASSLVDQRATDMADGYIFNVISHGVRSMPAYNTQITVDERWAITAYVRVLQKSHQGTPEEVPSDMKGKLN